ncbi:MAG: outer membrane protein assembly factor BamE [Rhodanobacteraceae bacterium]
MHKAPILAALALASVGLGGCGIIYKPDIQQGNVLSKTNVEQLKPGMSKEQVIALLGQPSVASPFDQSRWDYVSTLQKRGGKIVTKDFTIYFENDVLARTEGDYRPEDGTEMLKEVRHYPLILHDKEKEAEARRKRGGS